MRPYKQVVGSRARVLGDRAIGADGVTRLAALPSREVLLAQLAGGIAGAGGDHSPACSPRRCATWAMPSAQVADAEGQAAAARLDPQPIRPTTPTKETITDGHDDPRTSSSRRSRR